jgi:DUF971 family protein
VGKALALLEAARKAEATHGVPPGWWHNGVVTPTDLVFHNRSRLLEISFDDGKTFKLPYEYLRVYSPSAEVRGHGPGQDTLQTGKRDVAIENVEQVGHYAIRPRFSDGHDTGIYSWDYLHDLGERQSQLWQDYLSRLSAAGASRDPA